MADSPSTAERPRKPARRALLTHVESVRRLTPTMLRLVLGGEALRGFPIGDFTDHYVKQLLPPAGAPYAAPFDQERIKATLPREQWPRTRTYTVRDYDAERALLTIDVVVHGDEGLAGPWADAARPGDRLHLLGPGGAYAPDPQADWHLLVGDASVVPAIAVALSRIPAGVPVHVLIQVDGPEEEHPLPTAADLHLRWLHDPTHHETLLADALRAMELPAGAVHAFVHGEAGAVREIRRHLVVERAIPREALSVSGYWKLTRSDEAWRAEKQEWNRQVEADEAAAPG
jgi:NADPH-dependent ferric siderophore reductase